MADGSAITHEYFAIGSMINSTSIRHRGIKPLAAKPAVLPAWKIVFSGDAGMATLRPRPDADDPTPACHGVIWTLTDEDMKTLDGIEMSYDRVPVEAELYDGKGSVTATGYMFTAEKLAKFGNTMTDGTTPSERYIDIITRGCVTHGVAQSYIDWLSTVAFKPRAKPSDYLKIPYAEQDATVPLPLFSKSDLVEQSDKEGIVFLVACNGKVCRLTSGTGEPIPMAPRLSGKDITFMLSSSLYEPIYPIATCLEEMVPDHRNMVEDMMCSFTSKNKLECIGYALDWVKDLGYKPERLFVPHQSL